MPTIRIIKSVVDKLVFEGKQVDYFDSELKGFGIRVSATTKTFFCQKDIGGKSARKSIGRYGVWTVEQARDEAKDRLRAMEKGEHPGKKKKVTEVQDKTLKEAFAEYLAGRNLKPASVADYQYKFDRCLEPWHDRPLVSITPEEVMRHFLFVSESGPIMANMVFAIFSSIYNYQLGFAMATGVTIPPNPTRILSLMKLRHKKKRRKDHLQPAEYRVLYEHLQRSHKEPIVDAFFLILYTGLRTGEAERLLTANIDLVNRIFKVEDTKNGHDIVLPMAASVYEMLKRRKEQHPTAKYIFPGEGKTGKVVLHARNVREAGIDCTAHGLRRSFRNICEKLNFPRATVKTLMNHTLESDISDSYAQIPVDQLRPYVEKIGRYVDGLLFGRGKVIPMRQVG